MRESSSKRSVILTNLHISFPQNHHGCVNVHVRVSSVEEYVHQHKSQEDSYQVDHCSLDYAAFVVCEHDNSSGTRVR